MIADDTISPYYETSITSITRGAHENFETSGAIATSSTDAGYIEPQSTDVFPDQINAGYNSANVNYLNSQMTSSSNVTYYEPFEATEDGYLSPIEPEILDEEPGYQIPF